MLPSDQIEQQKYAEIGRKCENPADGQQKIPTSAGLGREDAGDDRERERHRIECRRNQHDRRTRSGDHCHHREIAGAKPPADRLPENQNGRQRYRRGQAR